MAGTISPPPMMVTAAPISLNRSAERPTVRYFRPLQLCGIGDFLLEPAERLGWHRAGKEAHQVEAEDLLHQLVIEGLAAAVLHPAEHLIGAPAPGRRRSEQRIGLVLAVPVGAHAMAAIERAGNHRVLHFERLGDGACRQQVELEPPAGHIVDAGDEVARRIRGRCPSAARCSGTSTPAPPGRGATFGMASVAAPAAATAAPPFRNARRDLTSAGL